MAKLNFNKSFFKKKRKQKYPRNKFFTYTNEDRSGKNFNFKDFRNSTSYNSKFNRALFYGTYFNKTTMKFCGFNGAFFYSITFENCNFKGSRFRGAVFENCYFKNCKLDKCDFKNAKFSNVFLEGTSIKKTKNFPKSNTKFEIPKILTDKFNNEIINRKYKKVLRESLTKSNLNRLLSQFSEEEILNGLDYINEKEINYISFSHITKFIERSVIK
ncbi:pentapeptide repeat-containing protein [Clostridium perfringens]|uniref:pentapeptide repeat-containing protein n=1 Tax=Clostridium perfringens TaxID=1502 RepID=UPI0018AA4333|nr:pentapeptide repeat-containing protein [Clostridium perfringens]MBS6089734.1 pentapeptide repeat-containing protein [Serratia marcescens]MDU0868468.1 pentapeptide repeat-containing protein [Clostridium perfringens]MDU3196592.1 pentapeptide repeat-containing protein [Clostridium perfringens]MDU3868088.1 pentapeptide repeat-containing protein [Clostridium perfringens]